MNQREAVYSVTLTVLSENNIPFEDGDDVKDRVEPFRTSINELICEGFRNKTIDMKDSEENQKKLSDPKKLKAYVSGLMSNWYRKDKRFNGNVKHTIKNPGSRQGQSDPKLKALKNLKLQMVAAGQDVTEVEGYIAIRVTELATEKAKKIEVDMSQIMNIMGKK